MEMILLKGHLITEQLLNEVLGSYFPNPDKFDGLNLMYAKKLDLLIALSDDKKLMIKYLAHLKELNRIRNKVAHELFFDKYDKDLKRWACSVLGNTPKTINTKRTYKNTVIKALSFMSGFLQGASLSLKGTNNSNKVNSHG